MTSNQLANLVQMSKWETKKMRNLLKQKFPEQAERHKNIEIHDMLSTGTGVLLVSKVGVSEDNIELNYWKKKKERGRLRL